MLETLGLEVPGAHAFRHVGSFDGAEVSVSYLVDSAEHTDRQSRAIGAVTDEQLLAGLLSLRPTELIRVERRFARALRESDAATVVTDPEGGLWGQRRLCPPVQVLEIEIEAKSWRAGCAVAHEWAGYAPRVVRVRQPAEPIELAEASHFGIGLVEPNGLQLVAPAPYCPRRWSSSRWRLAELVYEQFLELLPA